MELPKRKPTRLKGYDYSQSGAYFVTICTQNREQLLSDITVGQGLAPAETTRNTVGANISAEPKSDSPAPPRPKKIKKLYLRVPDTEGTLYRKARNLAEIFDEGLCVPLVFYNSATKAYIPQEKGIALSPFVMQQLVDLLGKENVIYQ